MARPLKQGLEYFPLDVDIDQDDKIAMIEALHGITGYGVVIKLLSKIYKEGYFYEWNNREQLLFSKRINVNINDVKSIVNDCINEGLFNQKMFNEYNILTSKGIQNRYLEAVKRRKQVSFIEKYYLISDVESIIGSNKIDVFLVNDDGNRVNVNNNSSLCEHDVNKSTQRKEKKRKEKDNNKNIVPKFTFEDMENAKLLFSEMQKNNPKVKQPNFDKWAEEFRKIREIDKREFIKEMISWTQQHEFWKTNVLSPATLRKQWDKLYLQAQTEHMKKQRLGQQQNNKMIDWENV
jgi:hypothetical protein